MAANEVGPRLASLWGNDLNSGRTVPNSEEPGIQMHAMDLVEIAIMFARHSESLVARGLKPLKEAVHGYWLTARYRHDIWSERIATHRRDLQSMGSSTLAGKWLEMAPVLQEILLTEPLTRSVAHQAALLEAEGIDLDFAALAESTFQAHSEARYRCLNFIVFGKGIPTELAVTLNRIRRTCESLTDKLLVLQRPTEDGNRFCFDPIELANARSRFGALNRFSNCRLIYSVSLSQWFLQNANLDIDYRCMSSRQNSRIATAVLGMFPSQAFDGFGLPTSTGYWATADQQSSKKAAATNALNSPLDLLSSDRKGASIARRW